MSIHDCRHLGEEVAIGPYTVWAGGINLGIECLEKVDVLVTLTEHPARLYTRDRFPAIQMHPLVLPDFGGVPRNWAERVQKIAHMLEDSKCVAFHCYGGFGRTGTILASLVALLESVEETPDAIAAVRKRYCQDAVETDRQATAVFALRGQQLPQNYPRLVRARG